MREKTLHYNFKSMNIIKIYFFRRWMRQDMELREEEQERSGEKNAW